MPNPELKHRCGGTLTPSQVMLVDEDGALLLGYAVPGYVCERCGEELIDRQMALEIQNAQTPTVAWIPPQVATTELNETISDLIPPPVGTLIAA